MTHPTITKDQAVQLALVTKLLSDGFCVSDSDAASIHTFAQAAYKLGRNAGLEEAKRAALDSIGLTTVSTVERIESLKDNT